MKALILALLISTPALAVEPATSPNGIAWSCLNFGLFVLAAIDKETGKMIYSTYRRDHLFDSFQPPTRPEDQKRADKATTMM
jgi:hypothetical protein